MKIIDIDETEWAAWTKTLPDHLRDVVTRFPPWLLYSLKTTGQRVAILSAESYPNSTRVTLRVYVHPKYNPKRLVTAGAEVYGIDPKDLEVLPESEREVIEKETAEMARIRGVP